MSFSKRTWEKRSRYWDRLNNIEDALANGSMIVPCVTAFNGDYADGDTISDDSLAALNYAYDNGVPCIGMFTDSNFTAFPYLFTLQGEFDLSGAGMLLPFQTKVS